MLKAIDSKVLCEIPDKENVTKGGIVIPEITKPDYHKVKVISKGSAVSDDIKVGDTVFVSGFQGAEFKRDDKIYKLFEDKQILVVIEDE